MSNHKKPIVPKPTTPRLAPAPNLTSQAFAQGREFGGRLMNEVGSDDLADALVGFKEAIRQRIEEQQQKIAAHSELLKNALNAL